MITLTPVGTPQEIKLVSGIIAEAIANPVLAEQLVTKLSELARAAREAEESRRKVAEAAEDALSRLEEKDTNLRQGEAALVVGEADLKRRQQFLAERIAASKVDQARELAELAARLKAHYDTSAAALRGMVA